MASRSVLAWAILCALVGLALADATTDEINAHVRFLSDAKLQGRGPGTPGERMAADYIEQQLRGIPNLVPAGEGGTYKQTVPLEGVTVSQCEPFVFEGRARMYTFKPLTDFVVSTDLADVTSTNATASDLVFVGYGIHAPELGWDDYKNVDVSGKVLLMLVGQPSVAPFAGQPLTYYGRWSYKYEEGRRRKAKAVWLVHTTETAGYPWSVVVNSNGGEQVRTVGAVEGALTARGWISSNATDTIGRAALGDDEGSLGTLFVLAARSSFRPITLPLSQSVAFSVTRRTFSGTNVAAALKGTGSNAREAVVFTGHLDHLGARDGNVYAGAIDNASGAAMVLALARRFASGTAMARTVLFLFPTGEEAGLLGSDYFAKHVTSVGGSALLPVACINFDIANVWGATTDVSVLGEAKSDLAAIIAQYGAGPENMKVSPDPAPSTGLFFRSDHFSFARRGVPGVWLFLGRDFVGKAADFYDTAIQQGYFNTVYHTPLDTYSPSWDLTGAIQQLNVAYRTGVAIASGQATPKCSASGCI